MPAPLSARAAYRHWYAAAGPWAGFFRAVPLVALARGFPNLSPRLGPRSARSPGRRGLQGPGGKGGRAARGAGAYQLASGLVAATDGGGADGLVDVIRQAGAQEGWLGRPDVLLVLDLPGATSVAVVAGLARWGVRPVLLNLLWPEPGALVSVDDVLAALLAHAPPASDGVETPAAGAQYAFALGRERLGPASAADLALRFDNRYSLGSIDLPTAARLRAGGVDAVVACRLADMPTAEDVAHCLATLESSGMPIRRLALS